MPTPAPDQRDPEAAEASRGSAVRLAAEILARALSLVTTLMVARSLGAVEFGEFAFLGGIALVAAELADLGLHGTVPRALLSGEIALGSMLRAKLWLLAGFAALTAALATAFPVLALLMAFFAAAGWAEWCGVAVRTWGRRGEEALVLVLLRAGTLAAVAWVIARGGGLVAVSAAHAVSPLPAIALGAALVARAAGRAEPAPGPAVAATVPGVLRVSAPLAVNGGLALVSLRVELIVLRLWRGPAEAGLFAAALRVIEALNAVPAAVSAGAMPALTREGLRGEGGVRRRTAFTVALLAAPAAVGLTLVAPGVMDVLYGAEFAAAAGPLRVLAWALVPLFLNAVLLHALIAVGRAPALPRLTAVRVGAALLLALGLAARYGAVGAAAGFLASELLLTVLAARACVAARFPVPVVVPAAAAVAACLPMAAVVMATGGGLALSIGVGAVAYAAVLAPAAWLLRRR